MLVSCAEWERNVIRERTCSGRIRRAQEGRNPGLNAPYGYRVGQVTGSLEIVPEEAAVVRRIYAMYEQWEAALAQIDEWESLSVPQRKHLLRSGCRSMTLFRRPRASEAELEAVWIEA